MADVHHPTPPSQALADHRTRSVVAGRIRQAHKFTVDALTQMAKGYDLGETELGVIESALWDALDAVRSIRVPDSGPF